MRYQKVGYITERSMADAHDQLDQTIAKKDDRQQIRALRRRYESWRNGVEGEQIIAGMLRKGIPFDSYYGYAGVPASILPRPAEGDLDFVIIGSTGIFLIDAKQWAGFTIVDQPDAPQRDPQRARSTIRETARQLTALFRDDPAYPDFGQVTVIPLIVFTDDQLTAPIPRGDSVRLIKAHLLVAHILHQDHVFDQGKVEELVSFFEGRISFDNYQHPEAYIDPAPVLPPQRQLTRLHIPRPAEIRTFARSQTAARRLPLWIAALILIALAGIIGIASTRLRSATSPAITVTVAQLALKSSPTGVPTHPVSTKMPTLQPTIPPTNTSLPVITHSVPTTGITPVPPIMLQPTAHPLLTTIGVYRAGVFYLRNENTSGPADLTVKFGQGANLYPIVGDWTGQGIDTVGVFDRNTGNVTLCKVNDSAACGNPVNLIQFTFGSPGDQPLAGRWQKHMAADGIGIFRASNGLFVLKNQLVSSHIDARMMLDVAGLPGDQALVGDWTGKGYDSPGLYRPTTGSFYLSNQVVDSSTPIKPDFSFTYTGSGDVPIAGDWTGQGHDGVGVFRHYNQTFYLIDSLKTGGADHLFVYGQASDIPVSGHWALSTGQAH